MTCSTTDARCCSFSFPAPFGRQVSAGTLGNPGLGWFPLLDFRTLSGPQVLGHPAFPHGTRIPLRGFCGWKRFSRQPERVSPCESRPLRPGTTNHPLTRAQVITVFIQRGVPSQLPNWKVDRQWNPTATGFQRPFRVTPATRHTPLIGHALPTHKRGPSPRREMGRLVPLLLTAKPAPASSRSDRSPAYQQQPRTAALAFP